jgi:hypothetical protein
VCRHSFHTECIATWQKQHNTCPLCRARLFIKKKEKPTATPTQLSITPTPTPTSTQLSSFLDSPLLRSGGKTRRLSYVYLLFCSPPIFLERRYRIRLINTDTLIGFGVLQNVFARTEPGIKCWTFEDLELLGEEYRPPFFCFSDDKFHFSLCRFI